MALGTVRCYIEARAPKETVINNAKYALKVYRSPDNRSMRTFYPEFLELTTPITPIPGGGDGEREALGNVRIVAALINPQGDDREKETVTLLNLSPETVDLANWILKDNLNNSLNLSGKSIAPGSTLKIELGGRDLVLSNRGGKISLFNGQNQVHQVSYSQSDVTQQGWTTLF